MEARSIATVPEQELLDLIYEDYFLSTVIGVPPQTGAPCRYRLRLTAADLGLPPAAFVGDLDSLLMVANDPRVPRAIQFKRIKVTADTFHHGQPNKLTELPKLVRQVNSLAEARFAFVWLSVIVVIDARERALQQPRLVPELVPFIRRVEDALPLGDLHARVGVSVLDIVQIHDVPFTDGGQRGGHMLRPAVAQDQPAALTSAIARAFDKQGDVVRGHRPGDTD